MKVDQAIRMVESEIPFNHLVGAKAVEVSASHAVWTLTLRHELANHIQTLHAAALWTLGEGTTGSIVAAGFPVEHYILVLKSAECRYRRTATAATAHAQLDPVVRERLLGELERDGKVDIPMQVVIRNEQNEDAYFATYVWSLRRR